MVDEDRCVAPWWKEEGSEKITLGFIFMQSTKLRVVLYEFCKC